jgi:protein tyrosine phosphatase (PTP) superfamily phosphohydrolase (DUF442 family)
VTRLAVNDPAARRHRRVRRLRGTACVLLAVLVVLAVVFRRPWFQGNFGEVETGRVYRSAQPTGNLPQLIRERGLTSVLNLRGGSPIDPWYADEVRATRVLGVDFYDFPMSAVRRPTRNELLVLIDVFGRCRYPLLIHCKSGSDRTGLAVAVYRMVAQGVGPVEASRALTLDYGHVPIFGTRRLHEPLDEYAAWLESRGMTHTPERFRGWIENQYLSDGPSGPPPHLKAGPREPAFNEQIGAGLSSAGR